MTTLDENRNRGLGHETGSEALIRRGAFVAFSALLVLSAIAVIAVIMQAFHY